MRLRTAMSGGLLMLLCGVIAFCSHSGEASLEYKITKSRHDSLPALQVQMQFVPDTGGVSYILYEDAAWGQAGLYNCIRDIQVSGEQTRFWVEADSGRIRIDHSPDSPILTLSYKVIQDFEGEADVNRTYRPIVKETYFHVFGHNLFMLPEHYQRGERASADIELEWEGWEPQEVIHNSFGSRVRKQELKDILLSQFHSSIFVGGDFRIHSARIAGNELHLATRGKWIPFDENEVMEILSRTIRVQRDFWGDHSQNYFTVSMRPFPQDRGSSFQGTGLTNSFATSVSNNEYTDLDQLVYLFNHELMHNWIGHTIENEGEEEQYWFSEGFTEYYTVKNIASNQIAGHGWEYYIESINEVIRNLDASPVRDAPNSEINYENFWSDRNYGKLPYYRGFLLAFYLDQQIQAVSQGEKSLDDVMLDLLEAALKDGQKLSHTHFIQTVNAYLPEDLSPFFEKHVLLGEWLPLQDLYTQLNLSFSREAALFDLGFTFNEARDAISQIDTTSVAYKAGVRKGDRVVSRSIYFDRTDREVELLLERENQQIGVTYLPVKEVALVQLENTAENQDKFRR